MAERDMPRESREEIDQVQRESVDVGTGLGGGLAPVLPTDVDGQNPDTDWLAASKQDTTLPNWTAGEELEAGLDRVDPVRAPLQVSHDTHIVTVFGDDLGEIEEVYGYEASDPQWASVKEGNRLVMVPLMSANPDEDGIKVPYPRSVIADAPEYPSDSAISLTEEMQLYAYYNERRMLPPGADSEQTLLRPLSAATA